MLVTLITHPGDRALAVNLCARIQQLGGVQNHECLIVSPQGTNMDGIENVLRRSFGNVFIHQYAETMKGWPAGPNEAAAHAMVHCWTNNALKYHYLILEPDCAPMHERWLDIIDMTYRQGGNATHVLGVKTDTRNAQGAVIGKHTVGVAVYPKNWPEICSPIKTMIEMSMGYTQQGFAPPPWDAYCGAYTSRCTAETGIIQHFQLQASNEGGFHWDCTLESAMQQLNPKAVLVHGCKHPEFLAKATGTKPIPIIHPKPETPKPIAVSLSPTGPLVSVIQKITDTHKINPEESKRKKEIKAFRWPKLKQYCARLGGKVHRVSRPDIEKQVLEIERSERKEKWTQSLPQIQPVVSPEIPVEDAPKPMIAPPISTAVRTAVPCNSGEATTSQEGGADSKFSPQMRQAMTRLIEERRAAGLA